MNENLLLIICAVGVVALIYLIRYIIAKVVYKGTDAIENKLRQIEPGTRAESPGCPVQPDSAP